MAWKSTLTKSLTEPRKERITIEAALSDCFAQAAGVRGQFCEGVKVA